MFQYVGAAGLVCLCLTAVQAEDFKDIEYSQAGNVSLKMDAHIPDGKGPFASAIIVHGGAWVAGDRVNNVKPLFEPLEKAGFAWFSISYRLAGDVTKNPIGMAMKLGAAQGDVRRAVAFVKEHAAEYRVDPNRIALIGESAGGQLAAMAGLRPDADGAVAAVVAFYTPSDLAMLARTTALIPDNVRDAIKGKMIDNLLMAGLGEFSPINAVSKSAPPFLLIHGTDDNVVPIAQSERFCEKLRDSGGGCELYRVNEGGHGMRAWEVYKLTDYKTRMVRWLQKVLAQS